jgi:hypothetical protein
MSTLDEIAKEKQRLSEALARVDAQREKLVSELNELEATERVLARYTKGRPGRRTSSAKCRPQKDKLPLHRDDGGASAPQPEDRLASVARRRWGIRSLPWQPAKRSRKSPPLARALAQTTSASSLPDTSGLAASKSATGNSTPHSRPERSHAPQSDPGPEKRQPRGICRRGCRQADGSPQYLHQLQPPRILPPRSMRRPQA